MTIAEILEDDDTFCDDNAEVNGEFVKVVVGCCLVVVWLLKTIVIVTVKNDLPYHTY